MTTRARHKRVTFTQPFLLAGLEGLQPAGTYSVRTDAGRAVWFALANARNTSTWIRVCRSSGATGVLESVRIDPGELAAALLRDAA